MCQRIHSEQLGGQRCWEDVLSTVSTALWRVKESGVPSAPSLPLLVEVPLDGNTMFLLPPSLLDAW